jgi:molybdopterin-guanine dinucleotide biosynthesis protein A
MPFASPELFAHEPVCAPVIGAEAVILRSGAGIEPFHAVYHRETCLPYVEASLNRGERRADAWFSQVKIRYLTPEETHPYDPDGLAFLNINTPEEFADAERVARDQIKQSLSG